MIVETPLTDLLEDIVIEQMLRHSSDVQEYWIPGEPVPNERPRIISRGGKSWAFTPSQTMKARQKILNHVLQNQKKRIDPPYSVAVKFVLSPEQKDSDVDNLQKLLFDAIFSNKKAIPPMPYKDDKHILNLVCFKRVGPKPGIHLWVMKPL